MKKEEDCIMNYGKLAKSVLVPVVGGSLVGIFPTSNSKEIYDKPKKPAFAPPSWTFPVAWTSLYTIMGIAKYRIAVEFLMVFFILQMGLARNSLY
jgi:tryptophan-rich sensory protein